MTIKKSNRGVSIDFDALMAKAGDSTAVGNMRVNAQGDVLGKGGEVVQKSEDRVRAYYKNNPRSSTSTSIKGPGTAQKLQPDTEVQNAPKTAATAKENVRTAKPTSAPAPAPVAEPDEFDAPAEPVGYREVELPNGDIEMVPVYKQDE
jgi:hypothetical protein